MTATDFVSFYSDFAMSFLISQIPFWILYWKQYVPRQIAGFFLSPQTKTFTRCKTSNDTTTTKKIIDSDAKLVEQS